MLHFRFFSATLLVPNRLIELFARYRFRIFVLAVIALVVYKKDIEITVGLDGSERAVAATTPTPTVLSVVPGNFWSTVLQPDPAPAIATTTTPTAAQRKRQQQLAYLDRYAALAVSEMQTSGIPASVTLAQALLESNVGKSTLATHNHNHFGIKCFSRKCRKGHCSNFTDDSHKDFFRIYPDAAESFRAHSRFLRDGKRYRTLFELSPTDYKAWAYGLKKAGYATDKRYAEKLIRLIEELELDRYDR